MVELRAHLDLFLDGFQRLSSIQIRPIEQLVRLAQIAAHLGAYARAAQAAHVHVEDPGRNAPRQHIRRNVLGDAGHSPDHGQRADPAVLVDAADSAEVGVVFDGDVAANAHVRGDGNVAADQTVMPDMRIGHDHILVAEPGDTAFAGGAVDGNAFADNVAIADDHITLFAFIFEILRRSAQNGARKDLAVAPDRGVLLDDHVRVQDGARADAALLADNAVRSDLRARLNLRGRIDDGRRVDLRLFRTPIRHDRHGRRFLALLRCPVRPDGWTWHPVDLLWRCCGLCRCWTGGYARFSHAALLG